MITLSPGLAQGSFEFIEIVSRSSLTLVQVASSFSHFGAMRSADVVAFSQGTGWVTTGVDGLAALTPKGTRILSLVGYEPRLRQALLDHIDASRPAWIQCAASGRSRVMAFAGGRVAQVMVEAGLASGFDDEVVAFWDTLAARARGLSDASLTEIGRKGERLTIVHEEVRTGIKPKWVAINNNADGYDVLSVVGGGDSRSLSIEVKTSALGVAGALHLTRNEWEMAQERVAHVFHLWDIHRDPPMLAKVSVDQMAAHISVDSGSGRWDTLSVPFKVFLPLFGPQSG